MANLNSKGETGDVNSSRLLVFGLEIKHHSCMKWWKRILGVVLLIAALGVSAWLVLRPKPSVYQASLDQLIASRGSSTEALTAFRVAGPQAVPFLIHKLTNSWAARDKYVKRKSAINLS